MPPAVSRRLVVAVSLLLAGLAAHDLSHAFDAGLDTRLSGLALVAVPQWIVLGVVLAVVLRGGRLRGAQMALALGAGATIGFTAVHLLPFAPAPYQDLDPSALSWLFLVLPTLLAVVVSALALAELSATRPPRVARGLR